MFPKKENICTKKVVIFAFMPLSVQNRAKIVVRYLAQKGGVTQAQIGQKIGYTNRSAFSAVLSGLKPMPREFCEKLAALDPEINPDFLSGESNDMLRSGYVPQVLPDGSVMQKQAGVFLPIEMVQMFTDLSATIRSQQETIRILVGKKDADAKAM